jgi:pimeloyl-ACP methyl ester carboxylesterase
MHASAPFTPTMLAASGIIWRGTHLVEGAGHWAQQEQPEEVSRLLLQFVNA